MLVLLAPFRDNPARDLQVLAHGGRTDKNHTIYFLRSKISDFNFSRYECIDN
jgi:hypothetical protein